MTKDQASHIPKDLINSGIVFEEQLISTLSDDLIMMDEFTALNEKTRNTVVRALEVLKKDSEEHNRLLKIIIEKY